MKLTEHFSTQEAACRCGRDECPLSAEKIKDTPALLATTKRTAVFLETVREFLGGLPLHTNSWWRCAVHNARVGGEENSFHMRGQAVDFTHRTLSPARVQAKLKTKAGRKLIDGLGLYNSFTHVDRRGTPANWNMRTK